MLKLLKIVAKMKLTGVDWPMAACLFTDDTVASRERKGTSESGVAQTLVPPAP